MKIKPAVAPSWSTSSFSVPADASSLELSELGEHVDTCRGQNGRLFTWRCRAEILHGLVLPRLVTTLVIISTLVLGGVALLY